MSQIPEDYVNYKSTKIFDKENVPKMFLHMHNTRAGVYGQICVVSGTLKFFGFIDRKGEVEKEIIIQAGETAVSPPQYWHKVEFLTNDTKFRIEFYALEGSEIEQENLSERD
ncbi:MAG: tellurite resistance-related uncharacterized protein [bacterium]|jgi:tellurite resistance-related uncharacterized protein